MKKLPAIILLLLITVSTLMQSCGESDCPLTTNSFAHFDFLDAETHQAVKFSPAFDVTGFITTDVIVRDTLEDGTIKETVVKDSLMNDTIFNKAESSMSLPLSYTSKTTYVLHYTEKMRDTITLIHQNIPYLQNIECGTMMFYKVEDIKYTTYNLKSIEIVNSDINNEEKKNFNIYYVVNATELYSPTLAAQEKKTTIEEEKVPFYQGTTIGVDIFGLGSKIFGGDITSTEISVEVNLKNRYVPVAEIGYGTTDTTDDGTNIHYKASAPYFRIGMNYNFFFKKPYLPGFLYGGIRYGFTSFSYDVDAPTMKDPTWGFPEIPFSYDGIKTTVTWAELLAGIKVNVYKNFYMGWSLRYRIRMNIKKAEHTEPWYIPGFGKNNSTNLGVTYSLIYKLPF